MNNDYLVKVLLDRIETLEKRVSALEKNQNPTSDTDEDWDWYASFAEAVAKYISL